MVTIGEVVLIYYKEKPGFFARIDAIEPDIKKDWLRVELLMLTIPVKSLNWILREEYINGAPFTMDGNSVRIEAVKPIRTEPDAKDSKRRTDKKDSSNVKGKIIPFARPKKEGKKGN